MKVTADTGFQPQDPQPATLAHPGLAVSLMDPSEGDCPWGPACAHVNFFFIHPWHSAEKSYEMLSLLNQEEARIDRR